MRRWELRVADAAGLAALALAGFALGSLLAAGSGGRAASLALYLAAAFVPTVVVRWFNVMETDEKRARLRIAVVSAVALIIALRLALRPDLAPWDLGWLRDLAAHPARTLGAADGHLGQAIPAAGLWLYAARRATGRSAEVELRGEFVAGFGVVAFSLLVGEATAARRTIEAVAVPYTCLGLFAVAVAHLAESLATGLPLRWFVVLAAVSAALGAAALASQSVSGETLATWTRAALYGTALAVGVTVGVLLTPVVLALVGILRLLVGSPGSPPPAPTPAAGGPVVHTPSGGAVGLPLQVLAVVVVGLVAALLVVAVGVVLYRLVARRVSAELPEEREALEGEGSLLGDLGALLAAVVRRVRPRRALGEPEPPAGVREVRRMYAELLARAAERGVPRPTQATPWEFRPALEARVGEPAGPVTEAYVAARYGGREPGKAERYRLRGLLERSRSPISNRAQ